MEEEEKEGGKRRKMRMGRRTWRRISMEPKTVRLMAKFLILWDLLRTRVVFLVVLELM